MENIKYANSQIDSSSMRSLNVIMYDFNKKNIIFYNVVPYFVNRFSESVFKNREELKKEVILNGKHMFWSRNEYEITINSYPGRFWLNSNIFIDGKFVNINTLPELEQLKVAKEVQKIADSEAKIIDVWDQIAANLEILLDILEPNFVKK